MNEDFVLPAIASPSSYMTKGLFDNELAKYEEEDLLSDVDSQPIAPEHAGDEEQEYFLLRYDPIKRGYWASCGDGRKIHAKQVEWSDKSVFMCKSCLFAALRKIIAKDAVARDSKRNKKVSAIF